MNIDMTDKIEDATISSDLRAELRRLQGWEELTGSSCCLAKPLYCKRRSRVQYSCEAKQQREPVNPTILAVKEQGEADRTIL